MALLPLFLPARTALTQGAQDWPSLVWGANKDLRDVRAVFAHPTDPQVVWVATNGGLHQTSDDGLTFKPVPAASADQVGIVTALACCPANDRRLVVGTQDKGLLLSEDGLASLKPCDSEAEKPASTRIAAAAFAATDPSWRRLLVTHGLGSPGMSISNDLGKTWQVGGGDRYLSQFVQSGDTFVAAGSMLETEGRKWGLHRSGYDGYRWEECNRNVPVADVAVPFLRPDDHFYASTLDGRILGSSNDGQTWSTLAESEGSQWTSLFFTHGRTDNVELLAAYDPHRRGVVLSATRMRGPTQRAEGKGLYVGPFVKTGAACGANANGSTYYVVLNNALWIGRRAGKAEGPMVVQACCSPPALWIGTSAVRQAQAAMHGRIESIAEGLPAEADVAAIAHASRDFDARKAGQDITVLAQVRHPKGASAIKVVSADLTLLGERSDAELFDDGRHNDGSAGDGLYGATVRFLPSNFEKLPERDRRWPLPGISSVTVTAIDTAGLADSWSAVVSVQRKPEPVGLHPLAISYRFSNTLVAGPVVLTDDGREGLYPHTHALAFAAAGSGPWRTGRVSGSGVNIYGGDYLTFFIKGSPSQDLYVQIIDRIQVRDDVQDEPHFSKPVHLLADGYLKAITPTYQEVRIPMTAVLPKGTLFLPRHAAGIALGADAGSKPGKYFLDQAFVRP